MNSDQQEKADSSGLVFLETFEDGEGIFDPVSKGGRWVKSEVEKYAKQPLYVKSADSAPSGYEEDLGLLLQDPNRYYAAGVPFSEVVEVSGKKDFVVQYEVKLQQSLVCGGAYLKLLRHDPSSEPKLSKLQNDTPYVVMFGPDKCGTTNKVHFILQHQNPLTGKWEEKHHTKPPQVKNDRQTHLYTLHIKSNNDFTMYVDMQEDAKGNLLQDMDPPVNPPAMIDDSSDKKPKDWVDDEMIPDPNASKPDDWDEDAPAMIEDMDAEMPEGWLEDAPEYIADPEAKVPDDWDEEEDGEWEAPMVPNPACQEGPGCGQWVRPMVANPNYRGKWNAALIRNPDFVGAWKPKQVENPDFFEDPDPHSMARMSGLAVEIWTTNGGILMDNLVVSHSLDSAFGYAEKTWKLKSAAEANAVRMAAKAERAKTKQAQLEEGGLFNYMNVYASMAAETFVEQPVVSALTGVVFMTAIILIMGKLRGRAHRHQAATPTPTSTSRQQAPPSAPAPPPAGAQDDEEDEEEEEEEEDEDEQDQESEDERASAKGSGDEAEDDADADAEDSEDEKEVYTGPTLRRRTRRVKD